jgi:hypothetical protein
VLKIGTYQTWTGELELVASRLLVLREYTEAPEMRFEVVGRRVSMMKISTGYLCSTELKNLRKLSILVVIPSRPPMMSAECGCKNSRLSSSTSLVRPLKSVDELLKRMPMTGILPAPVS